MKSRISRICCKFKKKNLFLVYTEKKTQQMSQDELREIMRDGGTDADYNKLITT